MLFLDCCSVIAAVSFTLLDMIHYFQCCLNWPSSLSTSCFSTHLFMHYYVVVWVTLLLFKSSVLTSLTLCLNITFVFLMYSFLCWLAWALLSRCYYVTWVLLLFQTTRWASGGEWFDPVPRLCPPVWSQPPGVSPEPTKKIRPHLHLQDCWKILSLPVRPFLLPRRHPPRQASGLEEVPLLYLGQGKDMPNYELLFN